MPENPVYSRDDGHFIYLATVELGVRKVVAAMKKEFQIDWTNQHRQDVLAKVTLAVKMVLMRENIKGEQLRFLTNAIIEKAKEKYKDWPLEA